MPSKTIVNGETVYKYRRADQHALSLLDGELWFSSYKSLNDPTDLNLWHSASEMYEKRLDELNRRIKELKDDLFWAKEGHFEDEEVPLRKEYGKRLREYYRWAVEEVGEDELRRQSISSCLRFAFG